MAANRRHKHQERLNTYGWPVFTKAQTEMRLALCKAAVAPTRKYLIRFKDCYENDLEIQQHSKLQKLSRHIFDETLQQINEKSWGGKYRKYDIALEGAFLPFVRCSGVKPLDQGAIWIGTKHDYPLIFINNFVAHWLCPYTKMGLIMTEPFDTYSSVVQNWSRLSNRKLYPCLDLDPVPPW